MRKLMLIILTLTLIGGAVQAGQDFTINRYFASNAVIADKFVGQLPQPVTIAVLEFKGRGIIQGKASMVAAKLREAMFKTGKYQVVSSDEINKALISNGFKVTNCNDKECKQKSKFHAHSRILSPHFLNFPNFLNLLSSIH